MLGLYVNVGVVVVLEVLKVRPHNLIVLITYEVDLALVTHNVAHSITKVIVQVNSCNHVESEHTVKVYVTGFTNIGSRRT